jgi:hypothetical protein
VTAGPKTSDSLGKEKESFNGRHCGVPIPRFTPGVLANQARKYGFTLQISQTQGFLLRCLISLLIRKTPLEGRCDAVLRNFPLPSPKTGSTFYPKREIPMLFCCHKTTKEFYERLAYIFSKTPHRGPF